MELRDGIVSIYRNAFDTTGRLTITVKDAYHRIQSGKSAKAIISLRAESDPERQRNMKDNLPGVTFSVVSRERNDAGTQSYSGRICLDFDDVNVAEYKKNLALVPYCEAAWISPRGNGVKAVMKIADGSKHREHFGALQKYFPECDPKCANPSRLCYESYDPEIYINEDAEVFAECVKHDVVNVAPRFSLETHEQMKRLVKWCESKGGFYSGNRNQSAFILAGACCRFGIAQDEAAEYIASNYASTDFTSKEIDRTVRSAYKKNKNSFGSAEFTNENLVSRETRYEINPNILQEGFKLQDVVYGNDVFEKASEIYETGYKSAETSHVPLVDKYFKWKRGELTLLSGIGNYGKTTYLYQLALIKALLSGSKFAIHSPENYPAEEFYLELVEMLLGCPCDGGFRNKPTRKIFERAYEFVSKHFFYIYPESLSPTPEYIKSKFLELILKEKVDGVIIDPFNQLSNDYSRSGGRDDKYLETFLSDCSRFAIANDVYFWIVAHPHKLQKNGATDYPCPDVFELSGGSMWNNKVDNILIYHRPYGQSDPNNTTCEHHSKKIRRQKIVGQKGYFEFEFNRLRRRFYFDGFNPLDGNEFEQIKSYSENKITPNHHPDKFIEPERALNEMDPSENLPF